VNLLLLVAQMIPAIVMAMGFYAIYIKLGLLDTAWGPHPRRLDHRRAVGVLIFSAFMSRIPDELLQAARIDGAGTLRTFVLDRPAGQQERDHHRLAVRVPVAWSDFLFANTLDNGGSLQPITLGIYAYIGNNNQQWNAIMATAVVASVPAAVLLVLAQRYVAAGVTAGAVKD
jgi:ABC-type sugar transport system, permease component